MCQSVGVQSESKGLTARFRIIRISGYSVECRRHCTRNLFIHFCSLNCFNQHGSSGQASGTSVSSASSGGMPVIQSVASLAPTSTASQVGASPVIPPSSIPSQPIPPPPPQVVKGQYIWSFYFSLTNFKMKTTSMDTLLSFFNI